MHIEQKPLQGLHKQFTFPYVIHYQWLRSVDPASQIPLIQYVVGCSQTLYLQTRLELIGKIQSSRQKGGTRHHLLVHHRQYYPRRRVGTGVEIVGVV